MRRMALVWPFVVFAIIFVLQTLTLGSSWAQTGVLTNHNDNYRSGLNANETILTPANVSGGSFAKLFDQPVDGEIYAQPLYVPNVTIPGKGTHNLVLVNTEGDSVYAFDADSNSGSASAPLWKASLIDRAHRAPRGATTVPSSVYPTDGAGSPACGNITPQYGSTSTPVIDAVNQIVYVEAFSREHHSFVHRLHALDLTTGAEKRFGPVVIKPTKAAPKSPAFNGYGESSRAALLLANGTVYVSYAAACADEVPFRGWVFAYNARTLKQSGAFVTTPRSEFGMGGIWMTGNGPAADAAGNIYLPTGNGNFDTVDNPPTDFGSSLLKLTLGPKGLVVGDYFTAFNQQTLSDLDRDISSGGLLLLPDQPGAHPHELVAAGKEGRVYVIDRDQFTQANQHYCANCVSDPQIVQESAAFELDNGMYGSPVYFNGTLYFWSPDLYLKAYPLSNGTINLAGVTTSTDSFGWPGANMSVSANGSSNGIIWAVETDGYANGNPAVLRAYDATNLMTRLYSSDAKPGDAAGPAVRFVVPTVVNGKVYVGSHDRLSVYGLTH